MSWLFSQALVEEYSAGTSLAGEPCAQLNAMPTPQGFWHRDKMTDASRLSRYGPTLKLLTPSRGEELLTSFLADSRARTSASPEKVQESTAQDQDFGQKCFGSFAMFDRDSCSWKTPQCSLFEDSEKSSVTWPRWGTMRNGVCWERTTSAPPTGENGSGFWPTPCASEYHDCGARWETLKSVDKGGRIQRRMATLGGLETQGTPKAALNPNWVEWLMGWPIGWSASEPLETDKFRQWRQQHSDFCSNESTNEGEQHD